MRALGVEDPEPLLRALTADGAEHTRRRPQLRVRDHGPRPPATRR